ncbi:unnamed protein product [Merluccius merluccius]
MAAVGRIVNCAWECVCPRGCDPTSPPRARATRLRPRGDKSHLHPEEEEENQSHLHPEKEEETQSHLHPEEEEETQSHPHPEVRRRRTRATPIQRSGGGEPEPPPSRGPEEELRSSGLRAVTALCKKKKKKEKDVDMMAFSRAIRSFTLELDGQPDAVYCSGAVLSGRVVLVLSRPAAVRAMKVLGRGVATAHWLENRAVGMNAVYSDYTSRVTYFRKRRHLIRGGAGAPGAAGPPRLPGPDGPAAACSCLQQRPPEGDRRRLLHSSLPGPERVNKSAKMFARLEAGLQRSPEALRNPPPPP